MVMSSGKEVWGGMFSLPLQSEDNISDLTPDKSCQSLHVGVGKK